MGARYELTTQRITINARAPLVWEVITGIGKAQLPGSPNTARLVERTGDNTLLVEFVTRSGGKTYTTLEQMVLYPPDRVTYRHLKGPLPYVWEEIRLQDRGGGGTTLLYRGEFSVGGPASFLAAIAARRRWNKLAQEHLLEIKYAAEARGLRSRKYPLQNAG